MENPSSDRGIFVEYVRKTGENNGRAVTSAFPIEPLRLGVAVFVGEQKERAERC